VWLKRTALVALLLGAVLTTLVWLPNLWLQPLLATQGVRSAQLDVDWGRPTRITLSDVRIDGTRGELLSANRAVVALDPAACWPNTCRAQRVEANTVSLDLSALPETPLPTSTVELHQQLIDALAPMAALRERVASIAVDALSARGLPAGITLHRTRVAVDVARVQLVGETQGAPFELTIDGAGSAIHQLVLNWRGTPALLLSAASQWPTPTSPLVLKGRFQRGSLDDVAFDFSLASDGMARLNLTGTLGGEPASSTLSLSSEQPLNDPLAMLLALRGAARVRAVDLPGGIRAEGVEITVDGD
jgi:hypothetical protein